MAKKEYMEQNHESRINANKKYAEAHYDRFSLQLDKGKAAELNNWIKAMREQHPDDNKYRTRNEFIVYLLERETGLQLKSFNPLSHLQGPAESEGN